MIYKNLKANWPYITCIQNLNNITGILKNKITIKVIYIKGFSSQAYMNKNNSDQNKLVPGNPKKTIFVINMIVDNHGVNSHNEFNSVIYRVWNLRDMLSVKRKNKDDIIAWLKIINIAAI